MDSISRRDREKLVREQEIVAAAEGIFSEKGFDEASMDEIAKKAEFTKRTLYQYFLNKEDLYLAVVIKLFKELNAQLSGKDDPALSGYARLEKTFQILYDFHMANTQAFRIIGQLGLLRKNQGSGSGKGEEFLRHNNAIRQLLASIIQAGRQDTSIRSDIEPEKAAASFIFLITGFFHQLSVSGETYTSQLSLDFRDFCFYSSGFLLGSVKNTQLSLEVR